MSLLQPRARMKLKTTYITCQAEHGQEILLCPTAMQSEFHVACRLLTAVTKSTALYFGSRSKSKGEKTEGRFPYRNDTICPLELLRAQILHKFLRMSCSLRLHNLAFCACMSTVLVLSGQGRRQCFLFGDIVEML